MPNKYDNLHYNQNVKFVAINEKLAPWQQINDFSPPQEGWLKGIRDALGLTTRQLGARCKLSQSRIVHIEKSEVDGNLTLDTIRTVAEAMECQLVYAIVPKVSLSYTLKKQLTKAARAEVLGKNTAMNEIVMIVPSKNIDETIMRTAKKMWTENKIAKIWKEN